MAIPLCGTFHYSGIVPDTRAGRESGRWKLEDQSLRDPSKKLASRSWKFWTRAARFERSLEPLRLNRLVGLEPSLRILGHTFNLEAAGRHRAQVRSVSLETDQSLIENLQSGDVLTLVLTSGADVGLSVLRDRRLVVAIGALTATPLGADVVVRGGRGLLQEPVGPPAQWPDEDHWVDVSVSGESRRLRAGDETTIRNHKFSVLRCFEDGMPGTSECLAISDERLVSHEAAVRAAKLVARPNAGLVLNEW